MTILEIKTFKLTLLKKSLLFFLNYSLKNYDSEDQKLEEKIEFLIILFLKESLILSLWSRL